MWTSLWISLAETLDKFAYIDVVNPSKLQEGNAE